MARFEVPKAQEQLFEPVSLETARGILEVWNCKAQIGARDYATILALLDSGLRASAFLGLNNVLDVNMTNGTVVVRESQGGKHRVGFFGVKTWRETLRYLRLRDVRPQPPLWTGRDGRRPCSRERSQFSAPRWRLLVGYR